MWLPDAHLCYFILSAARLCVAVLLHGAATSSAISPQMHQQNPADAPPESRGTIRIRRTPTESCLHLQRGAVAADQHQWVLLKEEYSAHGITDEPRPPVQRAPVTWREWGLWAGQRLIHFCAVTELIIISYIRPIWKAALYKNASLI